MAYPQKNGGKSQVKAIRMYWRKNLLQGGLGKAMVGKVGRVDFRHR